ncbi:MarR family transcriptional regulator [Chryseolinea sp. T2]|uniref:MarR family winged helix-turn-helix transcriptional regulator n=1 Tax=Chryseolinea sp. T2 TaxID=3129255 RepID=UPI003077EA3A
MSFEKHAAEARNDQQRALVNILHTYYFIINLMNDAFKKYDITRQQYNVLIILKDQHPKAASVNLIKARMLDKMSDVSRIVERLRIKGLVVRQSALKDKRAVDVTITPKGIDFLTEIDPEISRLSDPVSNLTAEETASLNCMLDKIRTRSRARSYAELAGEPKSHPAF